MKAFKHIDRRYAADFALGRKIKIGSLGYYRKMEGDRADPLDASSRVDLDSLNSSSIGMDRYSDIERERLKKFGFEIDFDQIKFGSIFSGNSVIYRAPDVYVFCCSLSPDPSRRKKGEEIFCISDVEKFAEKISEVLPNSIASKQVRRVRYREIETNLLQTPVVPNEFIKGRSWQWEDELRMAWKVRDGEEIEEYVFVDCLDVRKYISIV